MDLIPQPRKLKLTSGALHLPTSGKILINDLSLYPVAKQIQPSLEQHAVKKSSSKTVDILRLSLSEGMRAQSYRLQIDRKKGLQISASSATGAFYALQTLRQIISQSPVGKLPCLRIDDWPQFADRGIYYDVSRGRVPKTERLLEMAETLADYKINQLQLYIEHTFSFASHPAIGQTASPLKPRDILKLDDCCDAFHIELIPSLASFGHMSRILTLKEYRHLAEDQAVGDYRQLPPEILADRRGWSLTPARDESYEFLDSLYSDLLPLFRSKRFNVCCDETWDLGLGQSYKLCQKKGAGKLYLGHLLKLHQLCKKHGKQMMFWGDIIRLYPELVKQLPQDIVVLDWAYDFDHPVQKLKDFHSADRVFYACPGTSSWRSLFPRIHEASQNITRFVASAKRHGAQGVLTTDWGDGGHYNFMELSWYGYLFAAEQSWNPQADRDTFSRRFCRLFLHTGGADLVRAIRTLGDISQLRIEGANHSVWEKIFFATADDPILHASGLSGTIARDGRVFHKPVRLTAGSGRATLRRLDVIRRVLITHSKRAKSDPHDILPYWIFSVDTLRHAAQKLTALGDGGQDTPANRRKLKREMTQLMQRFEKLWLARNRRSEIRLTLKRYRRALSSL